MGKDEYKVLGMAGGIIIGVLTVVGLVFSLVYSPLSCSLAEECKTRAADDKILMLGIADIKEMMAEMRTDIKYMRHTRTEAK